MARRVVWRLQGIDARRAGRDTTEDDVKEFFELSERDKIVVKTLCPSVDEHEELTATVQYTYESGGLEHEPRLREDIPDNIEVDRGFEGFTPLYYPSTYDADIIAVTGLAGHAIGSWTLPNSKMWLRDFLPKHTPNARILTYGYESKILGANLSIGTLKDLAERFLDSLINMRNFTPQGDQRPMVLIGHSLGGLIIKMAMLHQPTLMTYGSRLPVRLIVFLATPHEGMNIDALMTVIKDKPPEQLVTELAPNSSILRDINQRFHRASDKIRILSFFELKKTATVIYNKNLNKYVREGEAIILTAPASAHGGYGDNMTSLGADADHSTIAKMAKGQGSTYTKIRDEIKQSLMPIAQIKTNDRFAADAATSMPHAHPLSHRAEYHHGGSSQGTANSAWSGQGRDNGSMASPASSHLGFSPGANSWLDQREMGSPSASSFGGSPNPNPWQEKQDIPSPASGYFGASMQPNDWQGNKEAQSSPASSAHASPRINNWRENSEISSPISRSFVPPLSAAIVSHPKEAIPPISSDMGAPVAVNQSPERMSSLIQPSNPSDTRDIAAREDDTNVLGIHSEECDRASNKLLPDMPVVSLEAGRLVPEALPIQEQATSAEVVPKISPPEDVAPPDDPSIFCNSCERPVDAQSGIYMSRETLETNDYDNDDDEPSVWCTPCQAKYPKDHNGKMRVRVEGVWYGDYSAYRLFISREPEAQDSNLVKAMKARDLLRVGVLAEVPGLRDPADANGNTPMHIAAQLGLVKEAECLLKHDSLDLEARNVISHTPLGTAILAKNVAMIRLLLDHGAELSTFDRQKRMALHLACLSRSPEIVSMILGAVPARQLSTYVNQTRDDGLTALLTACKTGEIAIVELLLEARAEPNIRSGALWATNLLPTSQAGITILHLLIDRGADLFATDAEGWTHLHVNAAFGRDDICSEILAIGTGRKKSTAADDDRSIKKRASRAAPSFNLDLKTKKGATALYLAARMCHKDAARVLLEHGASADVAYEPAGSRADWHTPLGIASAAGHEGLVAVLIKGGAPLDQVSNDNTALFLAASNGHLEVCRLLVEAGAGLEFRRQDESTAVFIAAKCGFVKVVRYLIDAGARDWPLNKAKTYLRLWFKSEVPSEIKSEIISILYDTSLRHF